MIYYIASIPLWIIGVVAMVGAIGLLFDKNSKDGSLFFFGMIIATIAFYIAAKLVS